MIETFKQNRLFALYTALVILLVIVAIFAPQLAPQDPYDGNMRNVLQPPSDEQVFKTEFEAG